MATLPANAAGEVRLTLRIPNGDGTDSPAVGYAWLYPNLRPGTMYRASNVDPQVATRTLLEFDTSGNLEDPETGTWAKVLASDAPGASFAGMQWGLEFHLENVKIQPTTRFFTVPAGSFTNVGLLADMSPQPSTQVVYLDAAAGDISELSAEVAALSADVDALPATTVALAPAAGSSALGDAVLLQALLDGTPAGGAIFLPAGTYDCGSAALVASKPVKIVGAGASLPHVSGGTVLKFSGNGDAITFTEHSVTVEDLAVVHTSWSDGAATPTAGTGIRFTKGRGSRLHRVSVLGFYDGIRFDEGYYYAISKCQVQDNVRYALNLLNSAAGEGDHGDQIIEGNTLGGLKMARIPTAVVHWESGGGLRFVGNKVNGSVLPSGGVHSSISVGLEIVVADGVSTSVMVITGNSIEGWDSAGIVVAQKAGATGTGSIGKIVITGNEIAGNNGTGVAINPLVASNFREAIIDGNAIGNCSTGVLVRNVKTVVIGANVYTDLSATVVTRLAGVDNFRMFPQTAKRATPGELVLYEDVVGDTLEATVGQARWEFDREIPDVTSETVYANLWKVAVPTFSGSILRVVLSGNLNGVGAFVYDATYTLTRQTGGVTATLVGSVTSAGGAINVQLDVASATGSVWVGVKRATGVGTRIQGGCGITLSGKANKVIRV